jgi:hypothetical protein
MSIFYNLCKTIILIMIMLSFNKLAAADRNNNPGPVNPNASDEARELLDFLYVISGKYILSGHHNYNRFPTKFNDEVKKIPGYYPVVWDSLTTPGTSLNNQWRSQADKVAMYLKQLQEAHVPVLWRPYHEMNGVWFRWCRHPGDEAYNADSIRALYNAPQTITLDEITKNNEGYYKIINK